MKRIGLFLCMIFISVICHADTINLHWKNYDGSTYDESTCVIDSDLILPSTAPTRYGYTFTGWKIATYTPVEYLESTGTQYIDTGFVSNQDTGIKTKIKLNNNLNNGNSFLGSGQDAQSRTFELYIWNQSIEFNYLSGYQFSQKVNIGDIVTIDWKKNIIDYWINDVQGTKSFSYHQFITPYNMLIFANQRPNGITKGQSQIYYFQIYDNNVLVRDFIPVLDYNGVPCMLDKVEGKFYYNQGTGQFIAGPVLTE